VPAKRFASDAEALRWIAARAPALGNVEVLRHTDRAGRLIGVTTIQKDATGDSKDAEQGLLAELGGDEGRVVIGNRVIGLRPAPPTVALNQALNAAPKSDPQCSGDLCTSNRSFYTNYYFYRSIGSETKVTSGSGRRYVTTVPGGALLFEFGGRKICSLSTPCPAGTTPQDTGQCSFRCYAPTTTAIRLSATFYARTDNGLLLPALTVDPEPAVGLSAQIKLTQWGIVIGNGVPQSQCSFDLGGPVECGLIGVCTRHETRRGDGRLTLATTSAGTTDGCGE
jgi:hypothetical protein